MDNETWKKIIGHLFVLCGIRPMDNKNHALYIAHMYAELKDKFTDEGIGFAARQIAENENLYGNYPPLSVWLKYCPERRTQQLKDNKLENEFLSDIQVIYSSPVINNSDMTAYMLSEYGERGQIVLRQFGGVAGIRQTGYYGTQHARETLLKDIKRAWNESKLDNTLNVAQIAENRGIQSIEKK